MNLSFGLAWLFRALLAAAIGAVIAWRVIVGGMADHLAAASEGADAALKWDARHSQALFAVGARQLPIEPERGRQAFESAVNANPADGRSYAAIARVFESQGNAEAAERAISAAAALAPRRIDVQTDAAGFWMQRGNITRAMEHLNVVLTFGRELWPKVFPGLLELAESPANHAAFAPLLREEVRWWPAFFSHVASHAQRLDTVRALFALQGQGPNAATPEALRAYLERLQREGYWTEAYFVWLNTLSPDQLKTVANVFNGGFEQPISNVGFDWISTKAGQVLVETATTYGTTGARALHVVFRGQRVAYRHLGQYLLLPPGRYVVRGRVRPESLESQGGVQWAVHCLGGSEPVGASERFTGSDQWRHFSFPFAISERNCEVQVLRLELVGRSALDFEAKGGIWFDELSIERQMRLD